MDTETHTQEECRKNEDEGRSLGDASTSQGRSKIASKPSEAWTY